MAIFLFLLDKVMNNAMSPELHSPTVTDLITVNMYEYIRKMKLHIIVCLTNFQMILLMMKTMHFS